MRELIIPTRLGQVSVSVDERDSGEPVVFMHGVFLDKTLWADYPSSLTGRTHIYIDMPGHGGSADVGRDWKLGECAGMLADVLDALGVGKCIGVGHSWGSMTALRAAHDDPERFIALALFNMPFRTTIGLSKLGFRLQKMLTVFQRFYAKQAARSLYTKKTLEARPELLTQMQNRLAARPGREIARVIDAVILNAEDSAELITGLTVPAIAVVGESDYVGPPPGIVTTRVPGGHISPHEAPSETRLVIERVMELADRSL